MRRFLLPAVLGLVAAGIAVMALSGLLGVDRENTFIQGEMDGTRIDVAAKFSARVAATPGRDGAPVRQGDLLLRLDGTEMEARVLQTRQELERARAQLEKALNGTREEEIRRLHQQHQEAVAALALAEKTHVRCRVLHAQQAVSTQRYDEAVNALTQARARERWKKPSPVRGRRTLRRPGLPPRRWKRACRKWRAWRGTWSCARPWMGRSARSLWTWGNWWRRAILW